MQNYNPPAVLVGGPPHSGKSVLVYSLTHALRARRVPHYVLRACPDGEGDWSNETDQTVVQHIRYKGEFTPAFVDAVAARLQQRHLPLLVDVGGKPTGAQEAVFSYCSHAVLLIGDQGNAAAYQTNLAEWQAIAGRQRLTVIARIKSELPGEDRLETKQPIITGTISGLERGAYASGGTFEALVEKIAAIFSADAAGLVAFHLAQTPVEIALDLPALARTLGAADGRWSPEMLPALNEYLPSGKPLAVYGRGPNWVYALLAGQAQPAPVWLFDARLGWVQPPTLPLLPPAAEPGEAQPGWSASLRAEGAFDVLTMHTTSQLLDLTRPQTLPLRRPAAGRGLVLNGRVPHWLLMAAVRQLAPMASWTAVYQPPLGGAVVVDTGKTDRIIGDMINL